MDQHIPQTPFALISGTAGWGMRSPDDLAEPGVNNDVHRLDGDNDASACESLP